MADDQISLPSLLLVLVLGGLVIRYFFNSSSATPAAGAAGQRTGRDGGAAVREAAVVRIQQMFPQLDRRTILWDLQRTGGSMSTTTERILTGRLETPPVTFQPPSPPRSPAAAPQTPAQKTPAKPAEPDLITRYNLAGRIGQDGAAATGDKAKGWSSNRDERQSALQKRRDEMILAARKKMEAQIAAEKAALGGSA